jgi:acetolactate synthase small subunit
MKKEICLSVTGRSGVLGRIIGALSRQKAVTESLTYGRSDRAGGYEVRIITEIENEHRFEQLIKQLDQLIDVLDVSEASGPSEDKEALIQKKA